MDEYELTDVILCNEGRENNITSDITNKTDPQLLLDVILNNRIDDIDSSIKECAKDILNYKFTDHGNKTIILIACINDNITKDTLNALCQSINKYFGCIDCFDEDWYKWEPLHYVARVANPQKLQVLLDNSVSVNCLTTFSENALHVLLEYQPSVKPYKTLLHNGTETKQCIIINLDKDHIVHCAEILIDAGIDVNHSNFWNETPICLAVRYRCIQITQLLLKVPTIDIDNYKEGRLTIRACLKESRIQETLPQWNALYEDPIKILFDYLKSGDEESFIRFNNENENINDFSIAVDGYIEFNTPGNMLQFCFKKGYFEYLQHNLYEEELSSCSITNNLMLNVFNSKGLGRCIEHLLNNGADPTLIYRKFSQPLLEATALVGYYPLVAILLQHKACKTTSDDIFLILAKLYEKNYELKHYEFYRTCVLSLMLNKLLDLGKGNQILEREELNILNDTLDRLNLERDDEKGDDSENICRILKLGASLTRVKKDNMIIDIIHKEILKVHFDDCIENNLFCYNSIIEDDNDIYSETRALQFLANNSKKSELLRHPLLIHYIHKKWSQNFWFFYINLFTYFLFLLSTYGYMVSSHRNRYNPILNIIFYFMLAIQVVKESIQLFFLYRLKYVFDVSNYFELTVIICSLINIHDHCEYIAVLAILFSTVVFVILLGQVPICAKYTVIFGSIKYFLQYAGFYFIQFVSFALVFYIIFPFKATNEDMDNNLINASAKSNISGEDFSDTVADLSKSLFYTLIFFTGEFSDRVLEPERFPVFGRIVMAAFIFCMTIILNNLLMGLIVTDMEEMQRAGKLYKQVKVANFIARINAIIQRLNEFKENILIKYDIINDRHIFKTGQNKILYVNNLSIFDDENLIDLKNIKNKRNIAYDKDLLKNIYTSIQENGMEYQKNTMNWKQ